MSSRRPIRARLALPLLASALATKARAQFWEPDNVLLTENPVTADGSFGAAVALGDFDGNSIRDVAVGAPNSAGGHGTVTIFRRGATPRSFAEWDTVSAASFGAGLEEFGSALVAGDFDKNGKEELVVGSPAANVPYPGHPNNFAGVIRVLSWSSGCDCFTVQQTISQLDTSTFQSPRGKYGATLAVGDFNGDTYPDLAIGLPTWTGSSFTLVGAVQILFGGPSGLRLDNPQGFEAGVNGMLGTPFGFDFLGTALAAGNFNGDSYTDLAIGAPGRDIGSIIAAGQVHILRGSASGLTTIGQQLLSDSDFGGVAANSDDFGQSLASSDFNSGGFPCIFTTCYSDLAIGVPGKSVLGHYRAGKVVVAYGASSGILTGGSSTLTQESNGGESEEEDGFGEVLAAGNVDKGRTFADTLYAELIVGVPHEDDNAAGDFDAGWLDLMFGSGTGVVGGASAQSFGQDGLHVAPAKDFDDFAASLAVGDLDLDGNGDLVAGTPGKTVNGFAAAGAVQVIFGGLFGDGFETGLTPWDSVHP